MDTFVKAQVLGGAAQYDLCGSCGEGHRTKNDIGRWIYPSALPDGRTVRLLKVLLSNSCDKNCYYCANRRDRDTERISFRPEELARLFDELRQARLVDGLFLSSAVPIDADRTMERMLATAEILRTRYLYRGYIHMKILPGASFAAVERSTEVADRVSVNLEAPSAKRLLSLTGSKDFTAHLLTPMRWVKRLLEDGPRRQANRGGQTTQFVVGAAGETDREIVERTEWLYRELNLARVYYSAFQPVEDTPLDHLPHTSPLREHRLYQTDFLLRQYGFSYQELIFSDKGNLPQEADPKMVWALNHPEIFPIEVNKASKEELLRIPGIGPRSAVRIVRLRRRGTLRTLQDLRALGAVATRAAPFILLEGRRSNPQLSLFENPTWASSIVKR